MSDFIFYVLIWLSGFAIGGGWILFGDWRIYRLSSERNNAAIRAYWTTETDTNSKTAHAMYYALVGN